MGVRVLAKIYATVIRGSFVVWLLFVFNTGSTWAFDLRETMKDAVSIGAAYTTHIFLHELGHQVVADDVDAKSHTMSFFTSKNGNFYPGLSSYESIPEKSKLPYALGGERMAGYTFEYALDSYRRKPSAFNKGLLFFSGADFLLYTLLANYMYDDSDMYDPNLIREETGISKGALLSIVAAKTLLNAYRVMNKNAKFSPMIWADKRSAALMLRFRF